MPTLPESRQIEYLPLDDLAVDPRNPKAHDVGTINASIDRFGVVEAIVRDDRTGHIVSGHGRRSTLIAMRDRGDTPPDGVIIHGDQWMVPVVTGWASRSDTEAHAALIALNRTTELGGWADDELLELLTELAEQPDGLEGVGYFDGDVEDLQAKLDQIADEPSSDDTSHHAETVGEDLANLNVLWGEPEHTVEHGDTWRVGRHLLVIAKLNREHHLWSPHLEGRVLVPYPEPYFALSTLAATEDLLFVTPVKYLAGHLLDKYASVHGGEQVSKVA